MAAAKQAEPGPSSWGAGAPGDGARGDSASDVVLFRTPDDVRAAIASLRVPDLADVLAEVQASAQSAGSSSGVDVDLDADLPLPADCLQEWAEAHVLSDRLRGIDMLQHARLVLSRVLRDDRAVRRLATVLTRGDEECETCPDDASDDADVDPGALATSAHDATPTVDLLENFLESPDHLSLNVTLKTRLGRARRETGRAVASFLGLGRMLRLVVDGTVRFNKLERVLTRVVSARLTVQQMNSVDEYAASRRPDRSLDQFDRMVREFIQTCIEQPDTTPESIAALRGVEFQKYPDGWGELRAFGPAVDLEALFQRTRATSRAIMRSELEALTVTDGDTGVTSDGSVAGDGGVTGADLRSVDDRLIRHLMFDTLVGAVPQTQVRVVGVNADENENAGTESDVGATAGVGASAPAQPSSDLPQDEFVVTVACPTSGKWLRRQAAVTVTMSLATLVGLGDDPATLGLSTPLPAAQARNVAAHTTVWRRLLYDPADGTVTDEAARTYTPTAAMRRAVEHKWRTCMAPGCTRNAERCEIDHCEPFRHADPERGGRTHPDNLVPLCVRHHQLKTDGVIRLRRAGPDEVEWILPLGVVTRTRAPSAVLDKRNASVPEEVLGLHLYSPRFEGPIVQEALGLGAAGLQFDLCGVGAAPREPLTLSDGPHRPAGPVRSDGAERPDGPAGAGKSAGADASDTATTPAEAPTSEAGPTSAAAEGTSSAGDTAVPGTPGTGDDSVAADDQAPGADDDDPPPF